MNEEQKIKAQQFLLQLGNHLFKEWKKERLEKDYERFKPICVRRNY